MLPQIFAPIFLEKIVMQKLLQNFAQKQSKNLLNAKKSQNYAEKQSENLLNAKKTAKLCGEIFRIFL